MYFSMINAEKRVDIYHSHMCACDWLASCQAGPHPHLRYIEWKGEKVYDFQKVTFSTLFKLYIAGLGVLIQKRYHMLG